MVCFSILKCIESNYYCRNNLMNQQQPSWEFPGGPVVKTQYCHYQGPGSIPGWGTKIPQVMWQKKKTKNKTSNIQMLRPRR